MVKNIIKKVKNWEAWPFKVIYAPLVPFWLYYTIRSGSVWFFTSSNPKITFGGMDGEAKKEMYDLLPKHLYPTTFSVLPSYTFDSVLKNIEDYEINFPLIVKPEVGGQGILFRKIDTVDDLFEYHKNVPVEYMVQRLVPFPMEVSVFYIRHPKEKKGKITGFLQKIPLHVIGDGKSSLAELVSKHPKAAKRLKELKNKHHEIWDQIPGNGDKIMLSYAANHNRGAHFVSLEHEIDDNLVSVFDEISNRIDDFFYGRYDIMCESIEDLKKGKNFFILEYNGCGAEPNHFYDTGYSLPEAYREILKHWKDLFKISTFNRKKGVEPWPFIKGKNFLSETNRHFKIMREADSKMK